MDDPISPEPSVPDEYQLKENPLTKTVKIHYSCPNCQTSVVSKLSDAGTQDSCPQCTHVFVVPGKRELDTHLREKTAQKAEKEAQHEKVLQDKIQADTKRKAIEDRQCEMVRKNTELASQKPTEGIENWLSVVGLIIIAAGTLILFGFLIGYDTTEGGGYNTGLLYAQMYGVHTGIGLIVAGVILCGLGPIELHLRNLRGQSKD